MSQASWRFCSKCNALFFDGYQAKGNCPGGGGHVAAGYDFVLPTDDPESPVAQATGASAGSAMQCSSTVTPRRGCVPAEPATKHRASTFCCRTTSHQPPPPSRTGVSARSAASRSSTDTPTRATAGPVGVTSRPATSSCFHTHPRRPFRPHPSASMTTPSLRGADRGLTSRIHVAPQRGRRRPTLHRMGSS